MSVGDFAVDEQLVIKSRTINAVENRCSVCNTQTTQSIRRAVFSDIICAWIWTCPSGFRARSVLNRDLPATTGGLGYKRNTGQDRRLSDLVSVGLPLIRHWPSRTCNTRLPDQLSRAQAAGGASGGAFEALNS